MISTPLNLCSLEKLPKFDYFCLDIERLVRLFGNCTADGGVKTGRARECCQAINRIIFERRKKAPINRASVSGENAHFFTRDGVLGEEIESFFVRT